MLERFKGAKAMKLIVRIQALARGFLARKRVKKIKHVKINGMFRDGVLEIN